MRYKADSSALISGSGYFRRLLSPTWTERRPRDASPWVVKLTDLDTTGVGQVLEFLHNKDPMSLIGLSIGALAELVTLIDYLDGHDAFRDLSRSHWATQILQ